MRRAGGEGKHGASGDPLRSEGYAKLHRVLLQVVRQAIEHVVRDCCSCVQPEPCLGLREGRRPVQCAGPRHCSGADAEGSERVEPGRHWGAHPVAADTVRLIPLFVAVRWRSCRITPTEPACALSQSTDRDMNSSRGKALSSTLRKSLA